MNVREKAAELASLLALTPKTDDLDGLTLKGYGYNYKVLDYLSYAALKVKTPSTYNYNGIAWRRFWGEVHARIMCGDI